MHSSRLSGSLPWNRGGTSGTHSAVARRSSRFWLAGPGLSQIPVQSNLELRSICLSWVVIGFPASAERFGRCAPGTQNQHRCGSTRLAARSLIAASLAESTTFGSITAARFWFSCRYYAGQRCTFKGVNKKIYPTQFDKVGIGHAHHCTRITRACCAGGRGELSRSPRPESFIPVRGVAAHVRERKTALSACSLQKKANERLREKFALAVLAVCWMSVRDRICSVHDAVCFKHHTVWTWANSRSPGMRRGTVAWLGCSGRWVHTRRSDLELLKLRIAGEAGFCGLWTRTDHGAV